jgi:hypothetical protein
LRQEVEWWAIKILNDLELMKMDLNDRLLAQEVEVVKEVEVFSKFFHLMTKNDYFFNLVHFYGPGMHSLYLIFDLRV